jgi:hypothetical protein
MSYADLVSSQNELLNNLSSENVNVEAGNIRAGQEFDKKKQDFTDAITKLQDKETGEIGKTEIMEGIPINVEDIGGVLGLKASSNLYKNAKQLAKTGLKEAPELTGQVGTLSGELKNATAYAKAGAKELFKPPIMKKAPEPKPKTQGEANTEGTETEAGNTEQETPNEEAPPDTTGATEEATQTARETAGATEGGVQAGESAGEDLLKNGLKEGESTMASTAGDIIGKAGAGLSIASGLELAGKDLTGLAQGKGWGALGDNTSERVGNILSLAGDVTSVVPGGEIVGGLLDLAGGAFDYFGEKSENDKINDQISQKQRQQKNLHQAPPQANVIHPSLSTLGIVSNVSHPVAQMIAGSGSF